MVIVTKLSRGHFSFTNSYGDGKPSNKLQMKKKMKKESGNI